MHRSAQPTWSSRKSKNRWAASALAGEVLLAVGIGDEYRRRDLRGEHPGDLFLPLVPLVQR
jgi:hypothetical protein